MTHVWLSEKVFIMKRLILIFILTLSFQSWTKADDIRDFQIEGMSIEDSLLDYLTEDEIKKNLITNYWIGTRKYYAVGIFEPNQYDQIEIYLKTDDKDYKIKAIVAMLIKSPKNCKNKKKIVISDIEKSFKNLNGISYYDVPHTYDKTGNSKQDQTGFLFKDANDKDHIRVECTYWSKKMSKGSKKNIKRYKIIIYKSRNL